MSCHGKTEEEGKQSRNPLQQNRAGYTAGQQMEQKSLFRNKIGIIGLFGSGKTTLMNIISGLYEIEENKVCQGYFRMRIHRNRS